MRHFLGVVTETLLQALTRHLQLVLHEVEVVRLLADVVTRVDWVHDLEACLATGLEHAQLRLEPVRTTRMILRKLARLVDREVCRRELLPEDLQEVGKGAAELLTEYFRIDWRSLQVRTVEREVLQHGKEHEDEPVAAERALEGRVEAFQRQILLEDEGERFEERMPHDLLLDILCTLLR